MGFIHPDARLRQTTRPTDAKPLPCPASSADVRAALLAEGYHGPLRLPVDDELWAELVKMKRLGRAEPWMDAVGISPCGISGLRPGERARGPEWQ